MPRIITGIHGDVTRYFGVQHGVSGKAEMFRGHKQDCRPILDRVKQFSEAQPGRFSKTGEHAYLGSVPRSVLHDWLCRKQKSWHDYATDEHLKAQFRAYVESEHPQFMAKTYQT